MVPWTLEVISQPSDSRTPDGYIEAGVKPQL